MQSNVEIRGSYQYASLTTLEAASAAVDVLIDSPDFPAYLEVADCFTRDATTLFVHARIEQRFQELFAATVLRTLAATAARGAVEVAVNGVVTEFLFVESLGRTESASM